MVLAPWLLEPGSLGPSSVQTTVASTVSPNGPQARRYLAALASEAPGIPPSAAGLEAFTGGQGADRLQLWTPANISFLPRTFTAAGHDHAHGSTWTPVGSLALVRSAVPY